MTYGKRLAAAMESAHGRGILSDDRTTWRRELADLVRQRFDETITVQGIGGVLRDQYAFKAEKNHWVASVLGVRSEWLSTELGPMVEDEADMHKVGGLDPQKRPYFHSNESSGIPPESRGSNSKQSLIPVTPQPSRKNVLSWEQLMNTILKEGFAALHSGVWVEVLDDSMSREFNPGDEVFLERVEGYQYKAGDLVLIKEAGGDLLVREYRAITSKTFDAVPLNASYGTLHSATHGLEVLAKVTRVTKMYR